MQLTSVFENGNPKFDYAYIENLQDGRGFTAGRVGFCTGTHDLVQVARLYKNYKPVNPLEPYLPRLEELDQSGSDSVKGLKNFDKAWKQSAKDPEMRCAQDRITEKLYSLPAMKRAEDLGVKLPFGKAMIYDTIVMHGEGDDPDGLPALLSHTTKELKGQTPKTGADERAWLAKFADVRKQDLLHPSNPATQTEWSQNAKRASILKQMLLSQDYDELAGPMKIDNAYYTGTIP